MLAAMARITPATPIPTPILTAFPPVAGCEVGVDSGVVEADWLAAVSEALFCTELEVVLVSVLEALVVLVVLDCLDVLVDVASVPGCVFVTETAVVPIVTTAVKSPGTLNLPIPESQQFVV